MQGVRKRRRAAAWRQQLAFKKQFRQARRGRFASVSKELKFHDVVLDDAVVVSGGSITDSINKIPQGVTEINRIGRKCTIRSINWRFNIVLPEVNNVATPNNGEIFRMMMYVDKQTNGATATVVNILQTADYQSFNNLSNKGRFRILMDRTYSINYKTLASKFDADTFSSALVEIHGTMFKKIALPIEFDNSDSDGRLSTIRTNNIGVLLISRSGIVGFFSQIRLRFSDD